ncbi:MAG: hypothetical protein ACXWNI_04045, partial [Candidatus Limnocylindrales bacterium]
MRTIDADLPSDDSPPGELAPARAGWFGTRFSGPVWVDAVAPTLLIHAVLMVFAVAAVIVFYPNDIQGTAGLRMWTHWDGPPFLELAARG